MVFRWSKIVLVQELCWPSRLAASAVCFIRKSIEFVLNLASSSFPSRSIHFFFPLFASILSFCSLTAPFNNNRTLNFNPNQRFALFSTINDESEYSRTYIKRSPLGNGQVTTFKIQVAQNTR